MLRLFTSRAPTARAPLAALSAQAKGFHTSTPAAGELAKVDALAGAIDYKHGGRSNSSGLTATVFGSTGFLARYVVCRLGQVGSQVICPYRGDGFNTRHLKLMGDLGMIVPTPMDLSDIDSVRDTVKNSNVVINCLGSQVETVNYNFHDANVKAVYRICKTAKEAGVKRFIHLSSVLADHDSPSAWARSKAQGEDVVRDFFPDATIIRTTQVYGAEDKFLHRWIDIAHYSPFTPLIDGGHQKIQPIYVGDVARAVFNAISMRESVGQTYHIAGPDTLTQAELAEWISQTIFKKSTAMEVPHELAKIYGYAYEFLPPRWRVFTRDIIEQMRMDHIVVKGISTRGLEELDVTPTSFYDEAPAIVMHHRQERALNRHGIEDREPMVPTASQYWEGKEGDNRFRKY